MENLEEVRSKIQKQHASEVRKTIESADIIIEVCHIPPIISCKAVQIICAEPFSKLEKFLVQTIKFSKNSIDLPVCIVV